MVLPRTRLCRRPHGLTCKKKGERLKTAFLSFLLTSVTLLIGSDKSMETSDCKETRLGGFFPISGAQHFQIDRVKGLSGIKPATR